MDLKGLFNFAHRRIVDGDFLLPSKTDSGNFQENVFIWHFLKPHQISAHSNNFYFHFFKGEPLAFWIFLLNWACVQSGFAFLLPLINPGTLYFVVIHPQGSQSLFWVSTFLANQWFCKIHTLLILPYFSLISTKKSCEIAWLHNDYETIVQFILWW